MSRLYIRVMTGFYSHRKTVRLRQKLGDDALWIPPRMWAYAAENQPDGDLSGYEASEIAMLIGYNGDATSMLQALKDCGFMDLDGMIHDWFEHNGYHKKFSIRAKKAAKARWAKVPPQTPPELQKVESGNRKVESGDKHCLSNATSIPQALELPGVPEKPKKNKGTVDEVVSYCLSLGLPESDGRAIFDKWEGSGWKNGGRPIVDWKATCRSWKTYGYFPSQRGNEPRINGAHKPTQEEDAPW